MEPARALWQLPTEAHTGALQQVLLKEFYGPWHFLPDGGVL